MGYRRASGYVITVKEAKKLDLLAREKFGLSTLMLMENAGRQVADRALQLATARKAKVAIFCGRGNNGGDGFCAARHLLARGINPDVYLTAKINQVKDEARVNLDILMRLKVRIREIGLGELDEMKMVIKQYHLIIDALVGVGLKGRLHSPNAELIKILNESGAMILSVDIPSGLDATSGRALGSCVRADETVTFVAKKKGMLEADGPSHCGNIRIADLGIPL